MAIPAIADNYISVAEAAERLGISKAQVRTGCQKYRLRLEGRKNDQEEINLEQAAQEDREPRTDEVACIWVSTANARIYLVDKNKLDQYRPFKDHGSGRKPGTRLVMLEDGRTKRAILPGEEEPRIKLTWRQEQLAKRRRQKRQAK